MHCLFIAARNYLLDGQLCLMIFCLYNNQSEARQRSIKALTGCDKVTLSHSLFLFHLLKLGIGPLNPDANSDPPCGNCSAQLLLQRLKNSSGIMLERG